MQVGSVLVDPIQNRVIGTGYNRMPWQKKGEEMDLPWTAPDEGVKWLDSKYGYGD